MPYLRFELDALNAAPNIARATNLPEDSIIAGMARLWAWCFREEKEHVTSTHLRGFFGGDTADALTAFGFLEPAENGWRVKGADTYLRVADGRRKGGRKSKGNLIPGPHSAEVGAGDKPETSRKEAGDKPEEISGSPPALTPGTKHHAPLLPLEVVAKPPLPPPKVTSPERAPRVYEQPTGPPDAWGPHEFFAWAQWKRQEAGFVGEQREPRDLGSWYSNALMVLSGDVESLQEAFYRFGESKHWQNKNPPLPFSGFVSQWDNFVPRRARAGP